LAVYNEVLAEHGMGLRLKGGIGGGRGAQKFILYCFLETVFPVGNIVAPLRLNCIGKKLAITNYVFSSF